MVPRAIFITGASRGLGLQFVKHILSQETLPKVLIAACRNPTKADDLQSLAKANDCLKVIALDVTKDSDIDAAFLRAKELLGDQGLNLLINNAGINDKSSGGFLENQTREKMQSHFNTNVSAPVLVTQKLLPLLKKAAESETHTDTPASTMSCEKAAVVNISSTMGSIEKSLGSNGNAYHYRSSKAALNMMTALISMELGHAGILATALHPGWVQTDMGGPGGDLTATDSVEKCWSTIMGMTEESTGRLLNYDGSGMPW